MKVKIQISLDTSNHFKRYKAQWTQQSKIYQKHLMIFEIERVEILLGFKANGETVVIWMMQAQTGAPCG